MSATVFDALQWIFDSTMGQPWLVNALGRELCFGKHKVPNQQTITVGDVKNAIEILILRCDVHLDQLADKLSEPRVERVIQSILLGTDEQEKTILNEDKQYLIDLGLIRKGRQGLEIANPIYREVIPRELTSYREDMLGQAPQWYVKADNTLDIHKVLEAYIQALCF